MFDPLRLQIFRPLGLALMLGTATLALSACSREFHTSYADNAPAAAQNWRAADVRVVVPEALVASDEDSFMPHADIVWHGDGPGDAKAQVAKIVKDATANAVHGLHGKHSVVFTVTLKRFHSITAKTYLSAPSGTGVHSVDFDLTVHDARTGAVLAGPVAFEASIPAVTQAELADQAPDGQLPGAAWKAQISRHITATLRGWLGTGPDIRASFNRMGA